LIDGIETVKGCRSTSGGIRW